MITNAIALLDRIRVGAYSRELMETRRGREVYPDRLRMLNHELRALAALGRIDEVERRVGETLLLPSEDAVRGFLGLLAARRGDREEALRISDQLEGMADPYDFGRDLYLQACIAAQLGDLGRAMVLLRDAYARGRPFAIFLHRDMDLEPLRDYPPFQEFIKPKG